MTLHQLHTKKCGFLRHTEDFYYTGQFAVNPYVTGSSPVARAKISAGFRGFLFFSNLKLFPFSVPKYRQYLYYFYTRMHFWGIKTDFFVYTFLYTAEIQGFLTYYFFMTYRILVRVSLAQKDRISWTLLFADTQILYDFVYICSIFCIFGIHFGIQKSIFCLYIFIQFLYTPEICGSQRTIFLMTRRMLLRMSFIQLLYLCILIQKACIMKKRKSH